MKGVHLKKQEEIADELGIPPSTLRTVLKNRLEIEQNRLVGGGVNNKK
jgi:DNA-directed RNA polymerase specialized sigma24 family protein